MDIEEDNDIVNNFSSDSEEENDINNNQEIINEDYIFNNTYNSNVYNFNFIYDYFKQNSILKSNFVCPI